MYLKYIRPIDDDECFRLSLVFQYFIVVSQCSVVKHLRCSEILSDDFTANLLLNLAVKES